MAVKLKGALSYTMTQADLARIVREKREKGVIKGSATVERKRLQNEINSARASGDTEKVERCANYT